MKEEGIGKEFIEAFVRRILFDFAKKNDFYEAARLNRIKEKIGFYKSTNESLLKIQNEPVNINFENTQLKESIFSNQANATLVKTQNVVVEPAKVQPVKKIVPFRPIIRKRIIPGLIKPKIVTVKKPEEKVEFKPSINNAPVEQNITDFAAIDKILNDVSVQTVECPGPNKQVLVYKNGKIQAANLTLNGDEINNIMNSLSKKTRIPIGSGFFKAAIGPYIITAVMSEFVGTRFIIQRKPQAQQSNSG